MFRYGRHARTPAPDVASAPSEPCSRTPSGGIVRTLRRHPRDTREPTPRPLRSEISMKKLLLLSALVLTALAAVVPAPAAAQESDPPMRGGKKVLTIDEYVLWRSIGDASISPDGAWI